MLFHEAPYVPGVQSHAKLRIEAVKLQSHAEVAADRGNPAFGLLLKSFWEDQLARIANTHGTPFDGIYLGHGINDIRAQCYQVQSHIRLYPNDKDVADWTAFCRFMADKGGAAGEIPVESISVTPAELTGVVGGSAQITATFVPSNATNKTLTRTTSDAAVATSTNTGMVSFKGAGTCTITTKTANGKTATTKVTVTAPAEPKNGVI